MLYKQFACLTNSSLCLPVSGQKPLKPAAWKSRLLISESQGLSPPLSLIPALLDLAASMQSAGNNKSGLKLLENARNVAEKTKGYETLKASVAICTLQSKIARGDDMEAEPILRSLLTSHSGGGLYRGRSLVMKQITFKANSCVTPRLCLFLGVLQGSHIVLRR